MILGFNPFALRKLVKSLLVLVDELADRHANESVSAREKLNVATHENERLKERIQCLEAENAKLRKLKDECFELTTGLPAIGTGIKEIPVIDFGKKG
ncbi:TPA: hypothetical protein ACPDWD_001469 [Pasteurella multocida]